MASRLISFAWLSDASALLTTALGRITWHTFVVHNPLSPGVDRRLGPVGKMQLAQDVADMAFRRLFTDDQACRDFCITQSLADQSQHLDLALGQGGESIRPPLCPLPFLHHPTSSPPSHPTS